MASFAPTRPEKYLSKSKLSTYLRTQCDRHLYLSLFRNNEASLRAANLPIPLKTRPAVQLITKSGQDFEIDQFDKLIQALPGHVVHDNNYRTADLNKALNSPNIPAFILQPEIEPENFRETVLAHLGVKEENKQYIPAMSDLRPDVLFLHAARPGDFEILPDGSRQIISNRETRIGISVIDLKNVVEANASYAAEVCLYAFFFANWLAMEGTGLKDNYYVSDQIYLWKHVDMPAFNAMIGKRDGTASIK